MTKPNQEAKLAEEIVNSLQSSVARHPVTTVEQHLHPTFDLLKRVHKLACDEFNQGNTNQILFEIEQLTREYDGS